MLYKKYNDMMIIIVLSYILIVSSYINDNIRNCLHFNGKINAVSTKNSDIKILNKENELIDTNEDNELNSIKKKKKKRRQPIGYTSIKNNTATTTRSSSSIMDSINIGYISNPNYNISFTVYGEPTPLSRHMLSKGRMYNPSGMHQREFAKACENFLPLKPLEGPLEAKMIFYFSRPKYQFRTGKNSHLLKNGISNWHSTRKDLDNLIKFVLDSLNNKAYLDDSQVTL